MRKLHDPWENNKMFFNNKKNPNTKRMPAFACISFRRRKKCFAFYAISCSLSHSCSNRNQQKLYEPLGELCNEIFHSWCNTIILLLKILQKKASVVDSNVRERGWDRERKRGDEQQKIEILLFPPMDTFIAESGLRTHRVTQARLFHWKSNKSNSFRVIKIAKLIFDVMRWEREKDHRKSEFRNWNDERFQFLNVFITLISFEQSHFEVLHDKRYCGRHERRVVTFECRWTNVQCSLSMRLQLCRNRKEKKRSWNMHIAHVTCSMHVLDKVVSDRRQPKYHVVEGKWNRRKRFSYVISFQFRISHASRANASPFVHWDRQRLAMRENFMLKWQEERQWHVMEISWRHITSTLGNREWVLWAPRDHHRIPTQCIHVPSPSTLILF